jgi:hypothetical protein
VSGKSDENNFLPDSSLSRETEPMAFSCAGAALNHSEAPPNYQYPEFSLQKSEGESTLVHISSRDSAQYDLFSHPYTFGAYSHGSMLRPQTDHPQYHY